MKNVQNAILDNIISKISWDDEFIPEEIRSIKDSGERKEKTKSFLLKLSKKPLEIAERTRRGIDILSKNLHRLSNAILCEKEIQKAKEIAAEEQKAFAKELEPALKSFNEIFEELNSAEEIDPILEKLERVKIPLPEKLKNRVLSENEQLPYYQELQISVSSYESFYDIACQLFEEDKTEDAQCVFQFLGSLNFYCYEVWISLGLCHQRLDETEDALNSFVIAAGLVEDNPLSYLYIVECLLSLQKYKEASASLEKAEELLTDENRDSFMPIIEELRAKI